MGEQSGDRGLTGIRLLAEYATALPELAVPWAAEPASEPEIAVLNTELATELGLDADWLRTEPGIRFLTGEAVPTGAAPVAMAYAGHQFGMYSPRLGDGRALLLGELADSTGRLHDLHLKGSGPTPFSRGGDGYGPLPAMLREHIMGEAMHALGIPTSRALAVVSTGAKIHRDGDLVPGAVLARVASSHLRVGTFQYARATGDIELLKRLADFALARHHPQLGDSATPYADLLTATVRAQADLIAQWTLAGFVHGVMNTDNMTISGETIDYGPCAFIDAFDPRAVFSSIDHAGRYAYGRQSAIGLWNLARLADALLPLLADEQDAAVTAAEERLREYPARFERRRIDGMRAKLGIAADDETVAELSRDLLTLLAEHSIDYTSFFRALAHAARGDHDRVAGLIDSPAMPRWLERWLSHSPDAQVMDAVNPVVIPRNHMVQAALDAAGAGSLDVYHRLLEAVRHPFTHSPENEQYAQPSPTGTGSFVTYCGT